MHVISARYENTLVILLVSDAVSVMKNREYDGLEQLY
jgi:hypothetical protein